MQYSKESLIACLKVSSQPTSAQSAAAQSFLLTQNLSNLQFFSDIFETVLRGEQKMAALIVLKKIIEDKFKSLTAEVGNFIATNLIALMVGSESLYMLDNTGVCYYKMLVRIGSDG